MVEAEAVGTRQDCVFGVLGPLQVTRGGVALSLGGRQQRAILARLLLADGAGLTVDQLARPTCQILPPGFPGHVAYCPYGGASFVPNVLLARSLVTASGTAGMTVDVYGQHDAQKQLQYVASVLRDIGYRPVTHLLPDKNVLSFIREPSNRVQVAINPGWIPDYPRPDAYFDFLFACPPRAQGNNLNGYCRPEVDELVAKAKSAQLSNPPEALALWAQVDHLIVDEAPVVPTANAVFDAFTSTRVGNVQTTPVLPMLLGQMWVK